MTYVATWINKQVYANGTVTYDCLLVDGAISARWSQKFKTDPDAQRLASRATEIIAAQVARDTVAAQVATFLAANASASLVSYDVAGIQSFLTANSLSVTQAKVRALLDPFIAEANQQVVRKVAAILYE